MYRTFADLGCLLRQVDVQPGGHVAGGDGAAEHPVDVNATFCWIGTAGTVLCVRRKMVAGWELCPSASWARDIVPAVVCSISVAPALDRCGLAGMNAISLSGRRGASRPVRGRRQPVQLQHQTVIGQGRRRNQSAGTRSGR